MDQVITAALKLNLGCGFRKKENFVNVDVDSGCMPDQCFDLVTKSWPVPDSSADEIVFEYSLEQMGTSLADLRHVLAETYRVARSGAKVSITSSHPRHDQFYLNPFCTQRISPDFFQLLSIGRNLEMIASGQHHDAIGMKWGINFEVTRLKYLIAPSFQKDVESGKISETEIRRRMTHENNICQAFEIDLVVRKDESALEK